MTSSSNTARKVSTNNTLLFQPSHGDFFLWVSRLNGLLLFLFVFGAMSLYGSGQLRLLGIAMIGIFALTYLPWFSFVLERMFPPPPELICYTVWVAWAMFTGYTVAIDEAAFWHATQVTLQMAVMVWTVYAILCTQKSVDVVFLAIIAGGIVQIGTVLIDQGDIKSIMYTDARILGLTSNPNSLAFRMVWCEMIALMYWQVNRRRFLIRAGILLLVPLTIPVLLATGSRKSFLAMSFLIAVWSVFASTSTKSFRSYFNRILIFGAVLSVLIMTMPFIMEHTIVGKRYAQFLSQGQGDISAAIESHRRYYRYIKGLQLFLERPLLGVGLENFKFYFYDESYSHSDYIEILGTTGLIGFLLYQAFYVCLLLRAGKLLRFVSDTITQYRLKMIIIGVLTIMLIGLGAPYYMSQPVFILLTTFSVYTWNVLRQVRCRSALESA